MKIPGLVFIPAAIIMIAWCVSVPSVLSAAKNNEFLKMIDAAERLDREVPASEEKYAQLARDIDALLSGNPSLKNDNANRKAARSYQKRFYKLTLPVTVKEPPEKLYTTTGFTSPLILTFRKNSTPHTYPYRIEISGTDAMLLDDNTLRVSYVGDKNPPFTKKLKITRASFNAPDNVLSLRGYYLADDILEILAKHFGGGRQGGIVITPDRYRLKTLPSSQNPYYEQYSNRAVDALFSSSAGENDFSVEVKVAGNGQFTIGGTYAGSDFDLLYGHPNNAPPNGIWSSLVSVKIDDRAYLLKDMPNRGAKKLGDGTIRITYDIPDEAVTVTQSLRPEKTESIVKTMIRLDVENRGDRMRSIGFRLLFDTWAGANDGVPFLIPAGSSRRIETNEFEFTPSFTSIWQAFDPSQAGKGGERPAVFLQNFLVGKDLVPPDRIAFANWVSAYKTVWDYTVNETNRVTGDSAVLLWWDPVAVPAGNSMAAATQFGAISYKREPVVFLVDPDTNTYYAILTYFNDTDKPVNVKYSLKLRKGELALQNGDGLEGAVGPGETFVKSTPLQVYFSGDTVLDIFEKTGETRKFSFPISARAPWLKLSMFSLVQPDTYIPVSYFLHKPVTLYAVLRASDGTRLKRTQLARRAWADGYRYTGKFRVTANMKGRVYVEIMVHSPYAVASADGLLEREALVISPRHMSAKTAVPAEPRYTEIFFMSGGAGITRAQLRKLAELPIAKGDTVSVYGFSSLPGTIRENMNISRLRALAVREALARRFPEAQYVVRYFGSYNPAYTNRTLRGQALNQRVLVKIERR